MYHGLVLRIMQWHEVPDFIRNSKTGKNEKIKCEKDRLKKMKK